ncbi:hypothetical protein BZA05DRAFT_446942 [Tricharina praecox]|uniref:uncharacterized protein n=1 Tax=Tricharina praecox TaxID=43433 RepID=UPI00221EB0F9|nr:uncharacterized protein BZA05DRAFT_446942 [Tricharina praecox]KAI5847451.1 hypothetical protein BZA05DRAFT_446942 [Tricharina praecox]
MSRLPQTQRALQFNRVGGPEVLEIATSAPLPSIKPDQILVKNAYAGVNYIDTYFRGGVYPASPLPYTLGREGEGTIVAIGSSVTDYKVGDYVGYMGPESQAEYTAVSANYVIAVPAGVEPGVTAAVLLQGLTAFTLIRDAHEVKRGDAVLVHAAAGGVGLLLCQLLRAVGAGTIIATASTKEKLQLAEKNGATHGIDYSKEDWVARVKEITGGQGVIAVFDGVGKSTFDGDLEVLARKGSLVSFGNASGVVPPFSIGRLSAKNLKVLRPTLFMYLTTKEEFTEAATELLRFVKEKKVDVKIHKIYSLEEAQQAHKDIEGRGTTGKLVYKL